MLDFEFRAGIVQECEAWTYLRFIIWGWDIHVNHHPKMIMCGTRCAKTQGLQLTHNMRVWVDSILGVILCVLWANVVFRLVGITSPTHCSSWCEPNIIRTSHHLDIYSHHMMLTLWTSQVELWGCSPCQSNHANYLRCWHVVAPRACSSSVVLSNWMMFYNPKLMSQFSVGTLNENMKDLHGIGSSNSLLFAVL